MLYIQPLDLFSDASYTYSVNLQEVSYDLSFHYNVRMKSWQFDLRRTGEESYLFQGANLVPVHEIAKNYNFPGLTGYFWLSPIGDSLSKYKEEPENLNTWFKFYYIYEQEDEQEE